MADRPVSTVRAATHPGVGSAVEFNKVLRNTYMLLGMTLAFSAAMAWFAIAIEAPLYGLCGRYSAG